MARWRKAGMPLVVVDRGARPRRSELPPRRSSGGLRLGAAGSGAHPHPARLRSPTDPASCLPRCSSVAGLADAERQPLMVLTRSASALNVTGCLEDDVRDPSRCLVG